MRKVPERVRPSSARRAWRERRTHTGKRHCVIDTKRPYNPRLAGWFENAITDHARLPFHAIIARANPGNLEYVLTVEEIDGAHHLFIAARDGKVDRNATALSQVAGLLLSQSKAIMFVDGYYDPSDRRYQRALKAYLDTVATNGFAGATCEITTPSISVRLPLRLLSVRPMSGSEELSQTV